MPGLLIPRPRHLLAFLLLATAAAPLHAGQPNPKKYPLRINVLASRSSTHIPVISLPSSMPADMGNYGGGGEDDSGGFGGPIPMVNLPLYEHPDPVFYGVGRADLFAADLPQGLNFNYDNCRGIIGVTMPHQPFLARWKRPNQTLELLIPIAATRPNRPQQWDKCELNVTLQNFVYLLLHNGAIVRVTQDGFARKPVLRQFTEGLETIAITQQPRKPTFPMQPTNNNPTTPQPTVLIHTQ